MTTPYTICDYLSRKGPCGKRCFGGRCRTHRKSESLTPCRNGCGKGTASISGFCAHVETCGWRQNDELARMREKARRTRQPSPAQVPAEQSQSIAIAQATALMATQHAALLEATAALMATQQALMQLSLATSPPSPPAVPHLPLRSSYRPSTCAPQACVPQAAQLQTSEVEDNFET